MIYLCRGHERAVCETEELAAAREAQGYRRCSAEEHRTLWAIANIEDRVRIVGEDWARIMGEQRTPTAVVAPVLPPGFRTFHIR